MTINTLEYLERAVWKTSKNLLRDFDELSSLRSDKKTILNFIQKSEQKTKEIIKKEVDDIPAHYFLDDFVSLEDKADGFYIYYSGLKDIANFTRSIEYFGYYLTCYKKSHGNISLHLCLISFPVRKSLLFSAPGKGAWNEKIDHLNHSSRSRLRVSNIRNIDDTIVNYELTKEFPKFSHFRNYGSDLYHLKLILMGKMDAALITNEKLFTELAELFIKEAGGFVKPSGEKILVSNSELVSQFK